MKNLHKQDKQTAKLIAKLNSGRVASSGDPEREEDARLIAKTCNHQSFVNYDYFMNNRDFLLDIVTVTPKPRLCKNYFYQYINKHLKQDRLFNFEFLSAVLDKFGTEEAKFVAGRFGLSGLLKEIVDDREWRLFNSSPSGKLAHIDY